jgi:hypothetical protein
VIGILIGAAILGIIIAVMEQDDFPGWGSMIVCVLAAIIPAAIVNAFLPAELFFVGLAIGALCAGVAISAMCGMTLKRASIAASIYLAVQVGLSLAFQLILRR